MSLQLARFSLDFYKDDQQKLGFVFVEYDGEALRAFPLNPVMALAIPSLEWVQKYKDAVWAVIDTNLEDDPRYLAWVGIAILANPQIEDDTFTEFLADYPHVRFFFTENWKFVLNDTEERNTFRIIHVDGTEIIVDRTSGAETIRITDAVNEHEIVLDPEKIRITHGPSGATITILEDGTVQIDTESKTIVNAQDDVEVNTKSKAVVNARDNVEVTSERGDVKVNAKGNVTLDAGTLVSGVVTGRSLDPFTGKNHIDTSRNVKASKA